MTTAQFKGTHSTTWRDGERPITLAILAMGGEGGGVLADWIVEVGEHAGWASQNTSVAGVATVYYVELLPPSSDGVPEGGRTEPILSLFPAPGEVDIVITSELMECGRAVQRGFATPDRTTLITSTNRVYSVDEKIALGDGRVDGEELFAAAQRAAKVLVAADFARMADDAGSVISASLYGALAGSGALPFTREQFEAPIRSFPKAAERSLKAFAAAYAEATSQVAAEKTPAAEPPAAPPARRGEPVPVTIGRRRALSAAPATKKTNSAVMAASVPISQ